MSYQIVMRAHTKLKLFIEDFSSSYGFNDNIGKAIIARAHWGLVDADNRWTRAEYVRNMKRKMAIYYKNGIKFISIYPDNLKNLDWIFRRKFKKATGFELPS